MKKTITLFWVFTGLFSLAMLFTTFPDILVVPDAVKFMSQLGYPRYIIPFLGVAKLLGVIAILIPRFPRLKEWAYAGLFFDLIGAFYSQVANNGFQPPMLFMFIFIGLGILSYIFYHKKLNESTK